MATQSLSLLIFLAFILAPDIQAMQMAYGKVNRYYQIHAPSKDFIQNNSSSNRCNNALGVCGGEVARPPPIYRCVSYLGVCYKTMSEARCIQLCYNYYTDLNPFPHCDPFPATTDIYCYCEHDCLAPSPK